MKSIIPANRNALPSDPRHRPNCPGSRNNPTPTAGTGIDSSIPTKWPASQERNVKDTKTGRHNVMNIRASNAGYNPLLRSIRMRQWIFLSVAIISEAIATSAPKALDDFLRRSGRPVWSYSTLPR
jgi:hypothetical protein